MPPPRPPLSATLLAAALRALVVVVLLFCAPASVRADAIPVRSAELRIEEGDVLLSAQFDVQLTAPLEEALQKGIPLYFTIDFELTRPRWWWIDEKLAQWSITYRISYTELTRQYRVASGPLAGGNFETLEDVQRFIGRVSSRPVARVEQLSKGARYEAALRMRLDADKLPKPFQVNAMTSHEWQLDSGMHRWSFGP
jgi:hypothetical protein